MSTEKSKTLQRIAFRAWFKHWRRHRLNIPASEDIDDCKSVAWEAWMHQHGEFAKQLAAAKLENEVLRGWQTLCETKDVMLRQTNEQLAAANLALKQLRMAVGLMTTLKGDRVMDCEHPVEMMQEVHEHVTGSYAAFAIEQDTANQRAERAEKDAARYQYCQHHGFPVRRPAGRGIMTPDQFIADPPDGRGEAQAKPSETPLALHASAPVGYKCTDCTMDKEPCPVCYAAWWQKRHPKTHMVGVGDTELNAIRAELSAANLARERAEKELTYIAEAERFNRTYFNDDSTFADWAQSRCRAAIAPAQASGEDGK